jgi:hypothetical protein
MMRLRTGAATNHPCVSDKRSFLGQSPWAQPTSALAYMFGWWIRVMHMYTARRSLTHHLHQGVLYRL